MAERDSDDVSPEEIMRTLAWMRRHNFKPVALRHQSKAAISQAYTGKDGEYKPPTDDLWRNNKYGVGCVTGPKNNGPLDVDLDCPEALFFAKWFLPDTPAIFGRKSKPSSHFLFLVDEPEFRTIAFRDPTLTENATIVEIRGDGGSQTVFPGSVHEDTGEHIWWTDAEVEPLLSFKTDTELLIRGVKNIVLATLISRYVWLEGNHNEPCKHIPGMLLTYGWSDEHVVNFMEAVITWDCQSRPSGRPEKSWKPTYLGTINKFHEGEKVTGAGRLAEQLQNDRLASVIKQLAGDARIVAVDDYNARFACVSIEGRFRIACTDPEVIKPGTAPIFYQIEDFKNFTATDISDVEDDKGRPISKARVWLANKQRRTYDSVDFLPGEIETGRVLNLWTGWAVQPHERDNKCEAWLELLYSVICGSNDDHYTWFLHWFANILREPMARSLTAPVLTGPEGAGKSLMMKYFGKILGPAYVPVTDPEHVHGRFNRHSIGALLLHSEEAVFAGDRKHAAVIRSLITDDHRVFEQKGIDAKLVRNFVRLVLTSNEANPAPTKPGDRRYTIFDIRHRKASEGLIKHVVAEFDGDGPASLFRYMLDMDYDPLLPRTNLKTDDLIVSKLSGLDIVPTWWHDRLTEGYLFSDQLRWATRPAYKPWPRELSSRALYLDAQIYAKDQGRLRQMPNPESFASIMRKMTDCDLFKSQITYENPMSDDASPEVRRLPKRMQSIGNMPGLEACRKEFERFVGQQLEWPEVTYEPGEENF